MEIEEIQVGKTYRGVNGKFPTRCVRSIRDKRPGGAQWMTYDNILKGGEVGVTGILQALEYFARWAQSEEPTP